MVPESLPSSAVKQTVSKETKNCPLVMNALLRIEIGWSLDLDWVVRKGGEISEEVPFQLFCKKITQ